jgi:hypothetical protein
MAPQKVAKAYGESSNPNIDVISDTSPIREYTMKTWMQVFDILQYELINYPDDSGDEDTETQATRYKTVAELELHKITAQPRLTPYNDMISWALEKIYIPTRTICNSQKVAVGYFRLEHFQVMYKLSPVSNFIYNANFLMDFDKKECMQYGRNLPDLIKDCCSHPEKFRADSHGVYAISSLETHMMCVAMMMCRLYGKENTAHFLLPWVPIMHTVAEGFSFNWAKILYDNLVREIKEYQSPKAKGQPTSFYMLAYIMDVICFMTPFTLMGWS